MIIRLLTSILLVLATTSILPMEGDYIEEKEKDENSGVSLFIDLSEPYNKIVKVFVPYNPTVSQLRNAVLEKISKEKIDKPNDSFTLILAGNEITNKDMTRLNKQPIINAIFHRKSVSLQTQIIKASIPIPELSSLFKPSLMQPPASIEGSSSNSLSSTPDDSLPKYTIQLKYQLKNGQNTFYWLQNVSEQTTSQQLFELIYAQLNIQKTIPLRGIMCAAGQDGQIYLDSQKQQPIKINPTDTTIELLTIINVPDLKAQD